MCCKTPSFFLVVLCVEINLQKIQDLSRQRKQENAQFKVLLRNIPTKKVDALVHQLNQEVSAIMDCTTCGNCCKQLEPPVDQDEINRLATLKGMNVNYFEGDYVGKEVNTGIQFLKCQPCIFLKTNTCEIYEQRPASCADYPHLHQPNFKFRWKSVMANYAVCPIVFNVVEQLKEELNYIKTTE